MIEKIALRRDIRITVIGITGQASFAVGPDIPLYR